MGERFDNVPASAAEEAVIAVVQHDDVAITHAAQAAYQA